MATSLEARLLRLEQRQRRRLLANHAPILVVTYVGAVDGRQLGASVPTYAVIPGLGHGLMAAHLSDSHPAWEGELPAETSPCEFRQSP